MSGEDKAEESCDCPCCSLGDWYDRMIDDGWGKDQIHEIMIAHVSLNSHDDDPNRTLH